MAGFEVGRKKGAVFVGVFFRGVVGVVGVAAVGRVHFFWVEFGWRCDGGGSSRAAFLGFGGVSEVELGFVEVREGYERVSLNGLRRVWAGNRGFGRVMKGLGGL